MKSYPLVLIDWIDPWSNSGWNSEHEVEESFKHDPRCQTVGWILKEDKDRIMLAGSRTATEDETGDLFVIPRRCIDSITSLSLCNPEKPAAKTKPKPRAKPVGDYVEMKRG